MLTSGKVFRCTHLNNKKEYEGGKNREKRKERERKRKVRKRKARKKERKAMTTYLHCVAFFLYNVKQQTNKQTDKSANVLTNNGET